MLPEPELQPEQSAENGLDLLDRALRSMARNVIRDGLRLPPLTLARITATGTVELYLATPAPPIPPFRAAHASTVWWCTEEEFGLLGAEAVRGIVAPYPALVSVGTSDDGATVLLDLEAVRLLHVSGPPEDVRAVLRTLALELTLTPLADRVGVHVVGVAEDLAVLAEDRLTVHPDLEHALVALRERDRDVRAELLAVGAATPRDARARGVGGDIWAPDVVLCAEYPSGDLPSALGRLLDARPRGSVAVVTAAPPPGAGPVARWTLPSRGVGALPGLDLTVRLQALDDGGYAAWLDALATEAGTELAQVEHLEPVAPPWPAPAGEPAAPGPWPDVPAPRSSERAGSASGSGASARGPWLVDSGAPGIRAEAGSPAPRAGRLLRGAASARTRAGPLPGRGRCSGPRLRPGRGRARSRGGEGAPGRGFGPEAESAVPEAGGSATGGGGVGRDAGPGLGAEGSALPADAPPPWLEGPAPRDGGASASGAEDGAPGPAGHGAAPQRAQRAAIRPWETNLRSSGGSSERSHHRQVLNRPQVPRSRHRPHRSPGPSGRVGMPGACCRGRVTLPLTVVRPPRGWGREGTRPTPVAGPPARRRSRGSCSCSPRPGPHRRPRGSRASWSSGRWRSWTRPSPRRSGAPTSGQPCRTRRRCPATGRSSRPSTPAASPSAARPATPRSPARWRWSVAPRSRR
ncbi:hypothetical protein ACFQZC_32355 [Streptacidiphilus monticola]